MKSILDIGATLERLDTLGVPVVGYRNSSVPRLLPARQWLWSRLVGRQRRRGRRRVSSSSRVLFDGIVDRESGARREGARSFGCTTPLSRARWRRCNSQGVSGKEVTPALLAEFARHTAGVSVQANRDLVVANAELAGEIAMSLALALA